MSMLWDLHQPSDCHPCQNGVSPIFSMPLNVSALPTTDIYAKFVFYRKKTSWIKVYKFLNTKDLAYAYFEQGRHCAAREMAKL